MQTARYQPPTSAPDPTSPAFVPWLLAQLRALGDDQQRLAASDVSTVIAQERIDVPAGALRRVSPTASNMVAVLEAPGPSNAGATAVLLVERPRGELVVVASPHVAADGKITESLINDASRATFSRAGEVRLRSNGKDAWLTVAEVESSTPGPTGPAGADGAPGATGATGPTGANGSLNFNAGTRYFQDDFIGQTDWGSTSVDGWIAVTANAAAGGQFSPIASELDLPGLRRLQFNTATTNGWGVASWGGQISGANRVNESLHSSNYRKWRWIVRPLTDATFLEIIAGWGDSAIGAGGPSGNIGANAVGIQYIPSTSANWQGVTRAAGTPTTASGGSNVAFALTTKWVLEATYDGTTWAFYANGTHIGSSTTNIPAAMGWPTLYARVNAAGAAARRLDADQYMHKLAINVSSHDET